MPIITNLEDKILQLVRANQYQWFTVGVNLGGTSGVGGGSGIPLGGFTGQLIQSKVTYDTTEGSSLTIPVSGQSLVHNLNRIRYWINQRGLPLVIQDEGSEVASGITTMNFVGAPVDVTFSGGVAIVTISGTGGGGGSDTVKVSSDDTTTNYLDNKVTVAFPITKVVNNPAANENIEIGFNGALTDLSDVSIITAVSGEVLAYTNEWLNLSLAAAGISEVGHTHLETDITNLDHNAVKIQTIGVSTVAPASGQALIYNSVEWAPGTVSGGAGGSSYTYALEDVTSQVPGAGDDYTLAATPASGSLSVHLNGLTQQPNNYSIITGGFHTVFTASSGDELIASYYTDVPSESILGLTLEVQDTDVTVAANVGTLNFEGMVVTNDGGGKVTVSGGTGTGGGGSLSVKDEGTELTATATSLNFLGSLITATSAGSDVTVSVSETFPFEGARWNLTANKLLTWGDTAWQEIDAGATSYTKDFDTVDDGTYYYYQFNDFRVPVTAYYRVNSQFTVSGNIPTAARVELGLFSVSTPLAVNQGGYYGASGIATIPLTTTQYLTKDVDYNYKILDASGAGFTVLGGTSNSYVEIEQIQPPAVATMARTYHNAGFTVNNITDHTILWNSESFDTHNFWAVSPNPERLTATVSGYFDIHSAIRWQANITGYRRLWIEKNGTTVLAESQIAAVSDTDGYTQNVTTSCHMNTNDYIEVHAYHNKGSASYIEGDSSATKTYIEFTQVGE